MKEDNKILETIKELSVSKIQRLKNAFTKSEIPEVDNSECIFINCKYYNITM